jgi:hypothetical protein
LNDSEQFEDVISFTIGESAKIAKFEEFELFIKRFADNFAEKIGDNKAAELSEKVNKVLKNIVNDFKGTADSEIAKYVFKFSEDTFRFYPEVLGNILKHILIFAQSLSDVSGMNR